MSQATRSESQSGTNLEVTEHWCDQYGVFEQGDSRVITVPAKLECEIGDGVEIKAGKQNGHMTYLSAFFTSLNREEERTARTGAIARSIAETETHYDCNEIRSHKPGKIVTIPANCDGKLFRKESVHLLFVGRVDGNLAYLKYVPKPNINFRFDGADF
jgi:hypothetical protein